jgi:cob(I)alamin adenosyltransferase
MIIYTREGDDGITSLSGGKKLPKHHPRIDAYGTVDELISWIGLLKDLKENSERSQTLLFIQDQLMRCACSLASGSDKENIREILPDYNCVTKLELEIDKMEHKLTPLKSFIVPGGHIVVSYCHITRCVCRRAERAVVRLKESEFVPEMVLKFLNRLSDFLFVLSRVVSLDVGNEEVEWHV